MSVTQPLLKNMTRMCWKQQEDRKEALIMSVPSQKVEAMSGLDQIPGIKGLIALLCCCLSNIPQPAFKR